MTSAKNNARGYTLVELLIVIALVGILATVLIPRLNPSIHEELSSAAHMLAAEMHYARSLAVTNNSRYRLTFDAAQNRFVLDHSGTNPLLEALPKSALRRPDDPPDLQTCDFDELPKTGPTVEIVSLQLGAATPQTSGEIEFAPLGGTSQSAAARVWLGCGHGENRRYISITIDPITGLADVGDLQEQAPPASQQAPAAVAVEVGI